MKIRKAYTLIEVVVTALIFSFILGGVGAVLVVSSRETDRAVAKTGGRVLSDTMHSIFMNVIRPAKKVQVLSETKIVVTDESDNNITFEYVPATKQVLKNGKKIFVPGFADTESTVTGLVFTSGTPSDKTVLINLTVQSKTRDYTSNNGFNSEFFCRNN